MEIEDTDALRNASQTRTEERTTRPHSLGKTAGKESKGQALEKKIEKIKEDIERALGIGSGAGGNDPTWQRVEDVLRGTVSDLGELEKLTREKRREGEERGKIEEIVEGAELAGLSLLNKEGAPI
jgi:hypothetical protein